MKHIHKIAYLPLCAAILLAACDRNRHTPDPDTQKAPISFAALSQIPSVKADDGTTPLSEYHEDFGVWGIARHSLYAPYILWETSDQTPMVKVEAVHEQDDNGNDIPTSNFVPVSIAYWIQGYSYSFIAVAPYPSGDDAFSNLVVSPAANSTTPDKFSLTIDMGKKYDLANPDFDFDLMGAAARSDEVDIAFKRGAQDLNFHHLLAQININVQLKDPQTVTQLGTVSKVRLQGVDTQISYTLSGDANDEFNVQTTTLSPNPQKEVIFTTDESSNEAGFQQSLNVVPQEISDYKLYLDFTLGTDEEAVSFTDFFVDIANASSQPADKKYQRNQVYNWNITISSKAGISFKVSVTPWGEQPVGDEIEIY